MKRVQIIIEDIEKRFKKLDEAHDNENESIDAFNDFVFYIKEAMWRPHFYEAILTYFKKDDVQHQLDFINIILSSNINIFTPWYKKALELSSESKNASLSARAKDILFYYRAGFEKVKIY